jgi:hypothetical protein
LQSSADVGALRLAVVLVATRSSDKVDFGKRVRGGLAAPLLRSGVGGHIEHRERGEKQGCRAFGDLSNRQTALMSCVSTIGAVAEIIGSGKSAFPATNGRSACSDATKDTTSQQGSQRQFCRSPMSTIQYDIVRIHYCKDPKQADDIFRIHLNGRTARTDRLHFVTPSQNPTAARKHAFPAA